jgi:hypothetical protein
MDRLNRRRAKKRRSAEVRIKFAKLSSQCMNARPLGSGRQATRGTLVFVRALVTVTLTTR